MSFHQTSRAVHRRLRILAAALLLAVAFNPLKGQSEELQLPAATLAAPPLNQPIPPAPSIDLDALDAPGLTPVEPAKATPPTPPAPAAPEILPTPTQKQAPTSSSSPVPAAQGPAPSLVPPAPARSSDSYFDDLPAPPKPMAPNAPLKEQSQNNESETVGSEWTVAIIPLAKSEHASGIVDHYREVYQSIPYRRSEYLANPSYRHDATMEFLFGQMRQTVVQRTDHPERVVNPRPQLTQPYPLSKGELYSYWPLLQYSYPLPLLSPIR